jgi:choline dehydrogenase-like flavoprotein
VERAAEEHERHVLRAFLDARTVPAGTTIETDLAIIGGGPSGIALALALANTPIRMLMLESGGAQFDETTQSLYAGQETGVPYIKLDAGRLRYLGGSSNHWGGYCRPLDAIDFEERAWVPHSGWPFGREALEPYFARAQSLVEAGPFIYDNPAKWTAALGAPIPLGSGGAYTTYFQFSKQRDSILPTHFGERYSDDLKRVPNLGLMLHANVTGLRLAANAATLNHLDVATLTGRRFSVKPKFAVVGLGGIESARLLLASNDVMKPGVGNARDLVGRFFADHPIPGETATIVVFDGNIAPYYQRPYNAAPDSIVRAAFSPTDRFKRARHVLCSLATIEDEIQLDAVGQAAVATTAAALGVDASAMRAYTVGCGMEVAPDPDRRLRLISQRDRLGMPRLTLDMRIADSDFADYHTVLLELGRQLLAAKAGMIRLNRTTRDEWMRVMDWGNHHMGSTRMHADPGKGVVDANSRVHGVANLFIAGSSVFPTYGASNPTLNSIALTLRLADHLRKVIA